MIVLLLFLLLQNFISHRVIPEGEEMTLESTLTPWALEDIFEDEELSEDEQIREERLIGLQADRLRSEHRLAIIGILVSEIQSERLTQEWVLNEGLEDDTMNALAARLLDESGKPIQEAVDTWREELDLLAEIFEGDDQMREESVIRLLDDRQRSEHRRAVIGILVSEIQSERLTQEWVLNEGLQDDTMNALAERLLDESSEPIQEALEAWREELEALMHNDLVINNEDVIDNLNGDNTGTDNILDNLETTYILDEINRLNLNDDNTETDNILDNLETTDIADELNRLALLNEFNLRYI